MKISSIDLNYRQKVVPSFKGFGFSSPAKFACLTGEASKQISSLKSTCKDLLTQINKNSELSQRITQSFENVRLGENSIKLIATDNDFIEFSLPEGILGNIFKIDIIKNQEQANSVIVNSSNYLIEKIGKEENKYFSPKKIDIETVNGIINSIHKTADPVLFCMRMFMLKTELSPVQKHIQTQKIKIPDIKPQKEISEKEKQPQKAPLKRGDFVPLSRKSDVKHQGNEFSIREVMKVKPWEETTEKETKKIDVKKLRKKTTRKRNISNPQNNKSSINKTTKTEVLSPKEIKKVEKKEHSTKIKRVTKKSEEKIPQNVRNVVKKIRINKNKETLNKQKVEKVKAKKVVETLQPLILSGELKNKIIQILRLHRELIAMLNSVSSTTSIKIRNGFDNVFMRINRLIFDNKIEINRPNRDVFEDKILNIKDLETNQTLNIYDSNKIMKNNRNWIHCSDDIKPIFMTEEEFIQNNNEENFNNIADKALKKLQDFKEYIRKKSWITQKVKNETNPNDGFINKQNLPLLEDTATHFRYIKALFKYMPHSRASRLKASYGKIRQTTAPHIEFRKELNNEFGVLFDIMESRHGYMYKIITRNDDSKIEEAYLITKDGKIVKNLRKDFGIGGILPGNGNIPLQFYSKTELQENNIEEKITPLIQMLNKEMANYFKYVDENYAPKKGGRPPKSKYATCPKKNSEVVKFIEELKKSSEDLAKRAEENYENFLRKNLPKK